jgi:hypothetical protein
VTTTFQITLLYQLSYGTIAGFLEPPTYVFVFDTTASTKFHLSFDKEEELPSDYTSQTPYDFFTLQIYQLFFNFASFFKLF